MEEKLKTEIKDFIKKEKITQSVIQMEQLSEKTFDLIEISKIYVSAVNKFNFDFIDFNNNSFKEFIAKEVLFSKEIVVEYQKITFSSEWKIDERKKRFIKFLMEKYEEINNFLYIFLDVYSEGEEDIADLIKSLNKKEEKDAKK